MLGLVRFMASPAGRILRIVAGGAIIAWGLLSGAEQGKWITLIGVLPILTGALNICVVAPLLGAPLRGSKVTSPNS